jgi:hypothetical protein
MRVAETLELMQPFAGNVFCVTSEVNNWSHCVYVLVPCKHYSFQNFLKFIARNCFSPEVTNVEEFPKQTSATLDTCLSVCLWGRLAWRESRCRASGASGNARHGVCSGQPGDGYWLIGAAWSERAARRQASVMQEKATTQALLWY